MIVSLGDTVSQSNDATAARNLKVNAFLPELVSAINALGYSPTVTKVPSQATMYIIADEYAITFDQFPMYPGRMIGPDAANGSASALAAQIVSDAKFSQSYFGPTGPAASAPLPTMAAFKPATASIVNLTRPGSSYFQVGDRWQVRVSGYENMHVCVTAKHPDGKSDTACYGSTDGSGLFTMTGTMDESTVGHWEETWQVGSSDAPAFSFDVLKVQATQQTQQQTNTGNQQATDKTPGKTTSSFDLSAFVSENKWLLLGGAGLAVFMLMGRGK